MNEIRINSKTFNGKAKAVIKVTALFFFNFLSAVNSRIICRSNGMVCEFPIKMNYILTIFTIV